jgi:hypothetical protein
LLVGGVQEVLQICGSDIDPAPECSCRQNLN